MNVFIYDECAFSKKLIDELDWNILGTPDISVCHTSFESKCKCNENIPDVAIIYFSENSNENIFSWIKEINPNAIGLAVLPRRTYQLAKKALSFGFSVFVSKDDNISEIQNIIYEIEREYQKKVHMDELVSIGKTMVDNRQNAEQLFWSNLLFNAPENKEVILKNMSFLGVPVKSDAKYRLVLFSVKDTKRNFSHWIGDGILPKILELFRACGETFPRDMYCSNVYLTGRKLLIVQEDLGREQLERLYRMWVAACETSLSITVTLFVSAPDSIFEIKKQVRTLIEYDSVNITEHAVFWLEDRLDMKAAIDELKFTDSEWITLFADNEQAKLREKFSRLNPINSNEMFIEYQFIVEAFLRSLQVRNLPVQKKYTEFLNALVELFQTDKLDCTWFEELLDYNDSIMNMGRKDDTGKIITKIRNYVNHNLGEKLSRGQIASEMYLSESYISHIWKSQTGESLQDFIIARKMEYAKQLISFTALPLSAVAEKTGYQNFTYFERAFKKSTGMTPGEFRKK
jgi:two-component system response regulator YesN